MMVMPAYAYLLGTEVPQGLADRLAALFSATNTAHLNELTVEMALRGTSP